MGNHNLHKASLNHKYNMLSCSLHMSYATCFIFQHSSKWFSFLCTYVYTHFVLLVLGRNHLGSHMWCSEKMLIITFHICGHFQSYSLYVAPSSTFSSRQILGCHCWACRLSALQISFADVSMLSFLFFIRFPFYLFLCHTAPPIFNFETPNCTG